MRILLVGNYALDKQESMLRFADLMQRELTRRGHTVSLLQPQRVVAKTGTVSHGLGKWLGYVDKFLLFPRKLKAAKKDFDLVHICDHSNAMYTKYLVDVPHVVTCHDVLAIKSARGEIADNPVSATGRKFQNLIVAGLRSAQLIVCDSAITRTDLLRVTGRSAEAATVVYLSLNYTYTPMPREEALARLDALGFDGRIPFFTHVGATVWYKNKLGLLQIFRRLRELMPEEKPQLLMVGGALSEALVDYAEVAGLTTALHTLSNVSNEDLRAVYSLAEGLIYPSLQEGFGWPVLEAQACGCPVFASDRAPMTELGGSAAVYFDPMHSSEAAATIAKALDRQQSVRDNMRSRGLRNVMGFSEEKMIEGYLAAYATALKPRLL